MTYDELLLECMFRGAIGRVVSSAAPDTDVVVACPCDGASNTTGKDAILDVVLVAGEWLAPGTFVKQIRTDGGRAVMVRALEGFDE